MKKSVLIIMVIMSILILSTSVLAFRSAMTGGLNLFNIQNEEKYIKYNFADLTDSCSMHTNINLSNPNYCGVGESEAFISYDDILNWSMLCCDFSSQCSDNSYTNVSNVCEDELNGTYTGYTYNNNGYWLAYCCDVGGTNCYVDTTVDPDVPSTTCDLSYTTNTFSLSYSGTWDAVCCAGGIE